MTERVCVCRERERERESSIRNSSSKQNVKKHFTFSIERVDGEVMMHY